jgi:hemerythrin-like domain-containing protein
MLAPERLRRQPPKAEALILPDPPRRLLADPLGYLVADHFRLRSLAAALRRWAEAGEAPPDQAAAASAFLERDAPIHHRDEDCDLFPMLRRRARPDDALDETLSRLGRDHRRSREDAAAIVRALQPGRRLSAEDRDAFRAYAAREHRHLAVENGVVIAIARVRLTRADLAALSAAMTARRTEPGP